MLGPAGSGRTELIAAPLRGARRGGRPGRADRRAHPERRQPRPSCATGSPSCSTAPSRSSGSRPGRASPSGCCATTRSRPGSTRSSSSPARPTGSRCCSTASTSCRCAATRSAATPPACSRGLLERIDALKAEGIGPAELRDRARAAERGAAGRAEREVALREVEFSELFDRHDAIMLELGVLDENELVLELGRVLTRHPDLRSDARRALRLAAGRRARGRGPAAGRAAAAARSARAASLAACDPGSGAEGPSRLRRGGAWSPSSGEFPDADADRARDEPPVDAGPLGAAVEPRGAAPAPTGRSCARPQVLDGDGRRGRRSGSGAARTSAPQAQAVAREIEQPARRPGEAEPGEICVLTGAAGAREPAGRRGARGAQRPLPQRRLGRLLRPPRGPRRDRLAAGARRPGRLGGGRPRADPAAGRAALGRPRPLHDDRPPPQARHDLGARGGAREPAAAAALARSAPRVPEALPGRGAARSTGCAPTSSCAA